MSDLVSRQSSNAGTKLFNCNTGDPQQPGSLTTTSSTPNIQRNVPNVKQILFIGDSISANIDIGLLAHNTKAEFIPVRAYSSVKDTVSNIWKQSAKLNSNSSDVTSKDLHII